MHNPDEDLFKLLYEDFSEVTCKLCDDKTSMLDCDWHRSGCVDRMTFTVNQLISKGWTKQTKKKSKIALFLGNINIWLWLKSSFYTHLRNAK